MLRLSILRLDWAITWFTLLLVSNITRLVFIYEFPFFLLFIEVILSPPEIYLILTTLPLVLSPSVILSAEIADHFGSLIQAFADCTLLYCLRTVTAFLQIHLY